MKGQVDRTVESSVEYHKFQAAFYVHMKGSNCSNLPAPVSPLPAKLHALDHKRTGEEIIYIFMHTTCTTKSESN